MPYLTPDTAPAGTVCRTLVIPDDKFWKAIVNGALSELCYSYRFEQFGTATPEETAAVFQDMFINYLDSACEDAMLEERPIRLTQLGEVESWTGTEWLLDRSRDPRTYIPLQRPHAEDANLQRESTGVAVSLFISLFVEQGLYKDTLDDGQFSVGALNDKLTDFIVKQAALLGVSPNPLAYICAAKVTDYWFVARSTGAGLPSSDAATITPIACQVFPFVDPATNYVTYEDWLTLKTNLLANIGNTYDSWGLWFERMLVLVGYKGLINALSADGGFPGVLGDGAGDGTYGNTHFDDTTCP